MEARAIVRQLGPCVPADWDIVVDVRRTRVQIPDACLMRTIKLHVIH
jgi:hypothetical protein